MSEMRYIGLYWPLRQYRCDPLRSYVFFEILRMVYNQTLTRQLIPK
jgi:hypothetical protein